jgi:biotin-dependent carboxylase-like uncharacterized protein
MNGLRVLAPGPLTTVQDRGRFGYGALGVGSSGAVDLASLDAANAAVGNDSVAAALEVTLGGLEVEVVGTPYTLALAGARPPDVPYGEPFTLSRGGRLRLRAPRSGVRTYLAVRGGIDVPAVLGSRATDLLCDLGPARPRVGGLLPVGAEVSGEPQAVTPPEVPTGDVTVTVLPAPRAGSFPTGSWTVLTSAAYDVTPAGNRIGVRLSGTAVPADPAEPDPEGLVPGAIQVPGDGQPIVVMADHPVTGGYPVIGVVVTADLRLLAQVRPGARVRFRDGS